MDHTNRFPRTLAGFGLTWHGGSRFSCFLEILETHFITKYIQIVPLASRLVLGFFWKPGHQIKPIHFPRNDPNKKMYNYHFVLHVLGAFLANGVALLSATRRFTRESIIQVLNKCFQWGPMGSNGVQKTKKLPKN